MKIQLALATAALLFAYTVAHATDPVGHYKVEGTSPDDGGAYSGVVVVTKTGDTYKVVWTIDGTKYFGTGIGADDFITISYAADGKTGVALYGHSKGGWKGAWTYAGGTKLGTETWTAE